MNDGVGQCHTGLKNPRIDVHRHCFTPAWTDALKRWAGAGGSAEAQLRFAASWRVDDVVRDMDLHHIDGALLSLPNPGVDLHPGEPIKDRDLARRSNIEGARLVERHTDRLGFLAAVPMGESDAAVQELAFALEELGADGVCLYTSAGTTHIGDDCTLRILEELDQRAATVLVHPSTPQCCSAIPGLRPGLLELPFDTTRAIARLHGSGVLTRLTRLKLIFCHGGGAAPFLAGRLALIGGPAFAQAPLLDHPNIFLDTALTLDPDVLALISRVVSPDNIVLGTDHPFASTDDHLAAIEQAYGEFAPHVCGSNATRIFPALAKRGMCGGRSVTL